MPGVAERENAHVFWEINFDSYIVGTQWTPDRTAVVAGTIEGDVGIIDVATGEMRARWKAHDFGLASVELSPDGTRILTCGQDGKGRLWSALDGESVAQFELQHAWGTRASYSPSGLLIAAAAGKRLLLLTAQGELIRDFGAQPSSISDLAWAPVDREARGEVLAAASYGGVTLFRVDSKPRVLEWKGSSLVVAWSPNGKYIATGDQDSTVHFWTLQKNEDLEMSGYAIKVKELAWSADSRYLATGGGNVVTVWDCSGKGPEGRTPLGLEGHDEKLTALRFANTTTTLASGDEEGRVIVWSVASETGTRFDVPGAVSTLAWSSDDALLAIGTGDGSLYCASVAS